MNKHDHTMNMATIIVQIPKFGANVFAHTSTTRSWQTLDDHLTGVSKRCKMFAQEFASGDIAEMLGLLHDIGKSDKQFQHYLKGEGCGCPHAYAGAKLLTHLFPQFLGFILSYIIAGHHTGLPDGIGDDTSLQSHLNQEKLPEINAAHLNELNVCQHCPAFLQQDPRAIHLWLRMLYSSLVDADWLDTEAFMSPERFANRNMQLAEMAELNTRYYTYMKSLIAEKSASAVNKIRAQILSHALAVADMQPGLFSLTVPTGGGKTLASLGFALRHAKKHNLKRIFYVIPYTTIIEQTSDVFRAVLGEENILEHHSEARWRDEDSQQATTYQLASENWDGHPVVVCSNVQFFESFYSAKPSRCRKLHNVANSVIIIDEAQKLPTQFLAPCVDLLQRLCSNYGCSVILCTATQPDLSGFNLKDIREIAPSPRLLYTHLKRTQIRSLNKIEKWEQLAEHILLQPSALCVVNTRSNANELFRTIKERSENSENIFHLSTWMCPQHRRDTLEIIRKRLALGEPTFVVSTSLVEAGVDIDFPVAYRAIAGLDSIAQVAGRCNREGKLDKGTVYIFEEPKTSNVGELAKAIQATQQLQQHGDLDEHITDPESFSHYFRSFYYQLNNRGERILKDLSSPSNLKFRTISDNFEIIKDEGELDVVVPYKEGETYITRAIRDGLDYTTLKRIQKFVVRIRPHQKTSLEGILISLKMFDGTPTPYVALPPSTGQFYCMNTGICLASTETTDNQSFII